MNAPIERWEPYRVITDEEALLETCIDRADDLNISRITIDEAGGFTPGYSAKLLCNPPMKTMVNSSLTKMLKALGLVLVAVVDDERFAGTKAQLSKRKRVVSRQAKRPSTEVLNEFKSAFFRRNGALGGKRRLVKLSKRERTRIAKAGAAARWNLGKLKRAGNLSEA